MTNPDDLPPLTEQQQILVKLDQIIELLSIQAANWRISSTYSSERQDIRYRLRETAHTSRQILTRMSQPEETT